MKIFDAFVYFQEIDILKLRLDYLYDYVDHFIIVESKQTHTGTIKEFNLERELNDSLKDYKKKIIYFKNEIVLSSFNDIGSHKDDIIISKILDLIKPLKFYNKNILRHVNDTFQREMIRYPLYQVCQDNDRILISDVDEIPNIEFVKDLKKIDLNKILISKHHEFKYYINNYSHSNWIGGTVGSSFKTLKNYSFNSLRHLAKKNAIRNSSISDKFGYHLTFFGGEELIKSKIKAYAHQEFNTRFVLKNIKSLIQSNEDIFLRKTETTQQINIDDNEFLDKFFISEIKKHEIFFQNKKNNKKINFLIKMLIAIEIISKKIQLKLIMKLKNIFGQYS